MPGLRTHRYNFLYETANTRFYDGAWVVLMLVINSTFVVVAVVLELRKLLSSGEGEDPSVVKKYEATPNTDVALEVKEISITRMPSSRQSEN